MTEDFAQRARNTLSRAQAAIEAWASDGVPQSPDDESAISDLMCDLAHLQEAIFIASGDESGPYTGAGALAAAEMHFVAERDGDDISGGPFDYSVFTDK